MESFVKHQEFDEIKTRLSQLPSGQTEVISIGVKNYLLWVGGNWEEKYDLAMHTFFAHAKKDMESLISDLEEMEQKILYLYEENKNLNLKLRNVSEQLDKVETGNFVDRR